LKLTTLAEPLLEFGTGTHVCPRTGIEHMGVYDKRDELRRTELRIGVVGRGEGVDLLDEWLAQCRSGIGRKRESKLLNLFRGFGDINQSYGFLIQHALQAGRAQWIRRSIIAFFDVPISAHLHLRFDSPALIGDEIEEAILRLHADVACL
jgi:hypothetical protein